jgi:hypothetical protein
MTFWTEIVQDILWPLEVFSHSHLFYIKKKIKCHIEGLYRTFGVQPLGRPGRVPDYLKGGPTLVDPRIRKNFFFNIIVG